MKLLLLFYFALIAYSHLSAQDSTIVTIKAGSKITDVLTADDIYHYPQFMDGLVVLKDGTKIEAKMNYNHLYDQMLFIDSNGDTLAMGNDKSVKVITIGQDMFYYDDGYIRLIVNNDFVKLAEKRIWVVADIQKIGTHDRPTNTVAVQSFTNFSNGSDAAKSKDLMLNENILLRKETQYYFGDAYGHFARANKKKLLLLFPNDEQNIEKYLRENKVNFDKKEDVKKLAEFLNNLY